MLKLRDKAVIAGYIQAGADNLKIAKYMADTYAGTDETITLMRADNSGPGVAVSGSIAAPGSTALPS